jgi:hypothetical protein
MVGLAGVARWASSNSAVRYPAVSRLGAEDAGGRPATNQRLEKQSARLPGTRKGQRPIELWQAGFQVLRTSDIRHQMKARGMMMGDDAQAPRTRRNRPQRFPAQTCQTAKLSEPGRHEQNLPGGKPIQRGLTSSRMGGGGRAAGSNAQRPAGEDETVVVGDGHRMKAILRRRHRIWAMEEERKEKKAERRALSKTTAVEWKCHCRVSLLRGAAMAAMAD